MSNLNLLPEEDDLQIEWPSLWLGKLIRAFKENNRLDEFIDFLGKSDGIIKTTTKFGNQVKLLLKEKELHQASQDARIIMLSATCPKRPDPEPPYQKPLPPEPKPPKPPKPPKQGQ
jgi:hypothetical protein